MLTRLRNIYPGLPQHMLSPSIASFHSTSLRAEVKTTSPVPLPRLPVPELQPTLERYVTSLKPFLREDEARGGTSYEEALALRTKWADDFRTGLGPTLQARLQGTIW